MRFTRQVARIVIFTLSIAFTSLLQVHGGSLHINAFLGANNGGVGRHLERVFVFGLPSGDVIRRDRCHALPRSSGYSVWLWRWTKVLGVRHHLDLGVAVLEIVFDCLRLGLDACLRKTPLLAIATTKVFSTQCVPISRPLLDIFSGSGDRA